MIVVTPLYCLNRCFSQTGLIPWYIRNEISNYGYMKFPLTNGAGRRFSIRRWLDENDVWLYELPSMPRYSEACETMPAHVRHPWDEEETPIWLEPTFSSAKAKMDYLLDMFADMNFDECGIMCVPFDGLPIGWTCRDGKVTLY